MKNAIWRTSSIPFLKNHRPLVMAHRGRSAFSPESSMLAFEEAVNLEVDCLETDVHITKDNVPVIFHDDTLSRTTDGKGMIIDHTFEQLQEVDLGYYFKDQKTGSYPFRGKNMRIISLEYLLQVFPSIRINIDIKDRTHTAPNIVAETIKICDAEHRTMVGSFHHKQIKRFREKTSVPTSASPKEVLGFLAGVFSLKKRSYVALQVPIKLGIISVVSPKSIHKAHTHDIAVHPWTINDEFMMKNLLRWDVDGIFTDNPELLLNVLKEFSQEK